MNLYHSLTDFDAVSYAEDHNLSVYDMIGLDLMKNNAMQELEDDSNDTHFNNELDRYQRIVGELGFELALTVPFIAHTIPGVQQNLYVYANRETSMILSFSTYNDETELSVNDGHIYYAVVPKDWGNNTYLSSGGLRFSDKAVREIYYTHQLNSTHDNSDTYLSKCKEAYWYGNHAARQGLRNTIRNILANSTPLMKWPGSTIPSCMFDHYEDYNTHSTKGYRHQYECVNELAESRYKQTPEWFQQQFVFVPRGNGN